MRNIRVPVMPSPDTHCFDDDLQKDVWSYSAEQLADREAQYLEMMGPVVEAMERISGYSMSQFQNPADMAAQCVDDAAKALAAITKD